LPRQPTDGVTLMLSIQRDCYAAMLAHARRCAPHECCGILGGTDSTVTVVRALRNVALHPHITYEFDPGEQLRIQKALSAEQVEFLGVYHSHPATPAYPSPTDIRRTYLSEPEETNYPGAFWVIISLAEEAPVFRVFTIDKAIVEVVTWQLV